jgi:threonine dehydratase
LPTEDDLRHARLVVSQHLASTPLLPAFLAGHNALLKLESLQPTGSFKVRGALSAMSAVPAGKHVLAASAGNHALGIAWTAQRLGIPATVVIAETASLAKRAKLETFPITLVRYGQSYDEAEAYTLGLAAGEDAASVFISPYNDPLVIAGAATTLDEVVAQTPGDGPLTVVVPSGGGGLLAGIALRAEQLDRPVTVVAVEAANSPATSAALAAGKVVTVPVGETIADGLSGNIEPGSITVEIAGSRVAEVVAVSEDELEAAIRYLVTDCGLVVEGAGAAATAAILAGKIDAPEGDLVAILSGRNIALPALAGILGG